MTRYDRFNKNNVNICINVNNNAVNDTELKNRVSTLEYNVNDILSGNYFESKLNQFLTFSEIEKMKSLVEDTSYQTIQNYIEKHTELISLLGQNKKFEFKETDVYLVEYSGDGTISIQAEVDGVWMNLNDVNNEDNDVNTTYKLPIKGYVIGIEIFSKDDEAKKQNWELSRSYDHVTNSSLIFMTKDEYDYIRNEETYKNKLKIYSLIIK